MANPESTPIQPSEGEKNVYSVWALPPEDVTARIRTLMNSLRSEFGGPQFEPHITVVGAIRLTLDDALNKFRSACEGLKAYQATVDCVSTGTFFYQCVFLLIHPTIEVRPSVLYFTSFSLFDRSLTPPFLLLRWWRLVHIAVDILVTRTLPVRSSSLALISCFFHFFFQKISYP